MPQQINLCTGLVKTQRERFTARTMLPALGVFVVLGGVLSAAAVWSLGQTAAGFRQTNEAQSAEIKNLQAAITQSRANATPVDPVLVQQLQLLALVPATWATQSPPRPRSTRSSLRQPVELS